VIFKKFLHFKLRFGLQGASQKPTNLCIKVISVIKSLEIQKAEKNLNRKILKSKYLSVFDLA